MPPPWPGERRQIRARVQRRLAKQISTAIGETMVSDRARDAAEAVFEIALIRNVRAMLIEKLYVAAPDRRALTGVGLYGGYR